MGAVTFTYSGIKEIDQILTNVPIALTHAIVGQAGFKAAKPLVEKIKGLAPDGPTGNLVDSIGAVKMSLRSAQMVGEVRVGPRVNDPYRGFHGHLNERGTVQRRTKSGANRGRMTAKPFVEPAWNATQGLVEGSMQADLQFVIVRTMKKYAKKGGYSLV